MQNIHKIHVKNLTKTNNKQIGFVEKVESVKVSEKSEEFFRENLLNREFLKSVIGDEKTMELLKFLSYMDMSKLRSFFNSAISGDKKVLTKLLQTVNRGSSNDKELKNLAERIVVVHKMMVLKSIFSNDRIKSAQEAVKNYK
tara:strand:+ start:292 stop:717 length:426 start_codon:yes stop_codon:yes gene_type:complete